MVRPIARIAPSVASNDDLTRCQDAIAAELHREVDNRGFERVALAIPATW
jgi:hypothetical protein